MDPDTPPARSRWSLCAEAGQLSPFGVADRHLSEIGLRCAAASKHSPRIVGKRPRRVSRRSPQYQHQLGQPRSLLGSADLPRAPHSLRVSAECVGCESVSN